MNEIVVMRVVKEFDVIKIKLKKEVIARIERLQAQNKCIACECEFSAGERKTCGVHADTCYQSQNYAIKKGIKTVRQLIEAGERLVPTPGGRPPASAYAARLLGHDLKEVKR